MIAKETDIYRMNEKGDARYLTFKRLEEFAELRHLFTTRWGGKSQGPCENWNLGYGRGNDPDTPENRCYNVAVLASCLGTEPERTIWTQQTHTTNIRKVTEEDCGKGATRPRGWTDVDGLMTNERNIALVTHHADCNAVYFYDPVQHAIGLAHSGWKGTLDGISKVMVEQMNVEYGSDPKNLLCSIGPSLCQDCFEVDADVAGRFFTKDSRNRSFSYDRIIYNKVAQDEMDPDKATDAGIQKYYIDLWGILRRDLEDVGVLPENIECMELCTKENTDMFFSHRGQHGKRGLMAAAMMLV